MGDFSSPQPPQSTSFLMASNNCDDPTQDGDKKDNTFLYLSYIDEMEDRVQALRRNASSLAEERDSLLAILSDMKTDCLKETWTEDATQELHSSIDQLRARCQSVQINIRVIRTAEQQSSFTKVDSLVTGLEHQCALGDPEEQGYRKKAESFLNACVSDQVKPGLIDYKFQGMILGCKLEDQKEFRQRLECLVQGRCHMNFLDGMMQQFNIESSLTSSDCDVISENNQGPNTEVPVESTVVSS